LKLYIDYGGTNFRYVLKESREVIENGRVDSLNIDLIEFLERKLKSKDISFIGISFAGQVRDGTILSSPNINISQRDIKKYIESRYRTKLVVENDLKCASLAEFSVTDAKDIVVVYIGTGFGSSYISNSELIRGVDNLAGEMGHIVFKEAPFSCGCGKKNCLELFCSGVALQKWVDYYKLDCKPTLIGLKNHKSEESKEILENFYNGLSTAISNIVTVLNPSLLVLGGGVIDSNLDLIDFIKEEVVKNSISSSNLKIKHSTLKNGAILGCELLEKID